MTPCEGQVLGSRFSAVEVKNIRLRRSVWRRRITKGSTLGISGPRAKGCPTATKALAKELAQLRAPCRACEIESRATRLKTDVSGKLLKLFQNATVRSNQESGSGTPIVSKNTTSGGVDLRSPEICRSILTCPVDSLRRDAAKREGMSRSPQSSQPYEATGGMQARCTQASRPKETPQSKPAYFRCKAAQAPHICCPLDAHDESKPCLAWNVSPRYGAEGTR